MDDSLLTVKNVCNLLQVSAATVYRYSDQGLLSHFKTKFGLRFKKEEIEAWLSQYQYKGIFPSRALNKILTIPFDRSMEDAKGDGELPKGKTKTRLNFGYGAIYQRKTTGGKIRWYLDYRDREGKRIQKVAPHAISKSEAVGALKNAVLKEHYRECRIKEDEQPIRFKEFVEMFIENYSKVNKRSWKDDKYRLKKCLEYFGNVYLNELSPIEIEKLKSDKLNQGLSKTTVNHYLKVLKRLFNIAIDWGYAQENPVKRIKFFSEKDSIKERILTKEEEDRLLEAASERLRSILVIGLYSGLRRREILDLTWDQIDFQEKIIKIQRTKSGKPRIVEINSTVLDELERLKKSNSNSQYVFYNPDTRKPFVTVRRSFQNACRRAKIEGLRFHDLRHSFASRLIEKGVDIIKVKDLLGHSTVKVTERYTHPGREEKKRAVELLCQKTPKTGETKGDLLHICDMKKGKKESVFISSLFSVN